MEKASLGHQYFCPRPVHTLTERGGWGDVWVAASLTSHVHVLGRAAVLGVGPRGQLGEPLGAQVEGEAEGVVHEHLVRYG